MNTKAVFFDVANTLLHKPQLYPAMATVLRARGVDISLGALAIRHRLLSEVVNFPDATSPEFYSDFNSHLLRSLGILPEQGLLDELFSACSYLPWQPFADTEALAEIPLPLGVLSNWDKSLREKLGGIKGQRFEWILGSAEQGVRKPDPLFFAEIIRSTGMAPAEILYVGDSMKLDIEPALRAGMRAILVDREDLYPYCNTMRVDGLNRIGAFL